MVAPFFPVPFEALRSKIIYADICRTSFFIDTVEIIPIVISHPNMGLGFKFVEDGKSFVFLTDNELGHRHRGGRTFDEYLKFSEGADYLFHDAEYSPEQYKTNITWGHSTYTDALRLAVGARVRSFGLFHHNQERFDDALDEIVQQCRETVAADKLDMEIFALTQTTELVL